MHTVGYGAGDRMFVFFFFFSCLEMILLTVSSRLIDANQDTEETMSLL